MKRFWQELKYRISLGLNWCPPPMSKRGAKLLRDNPSLGFWIVENREELSKTGLTIPEKLPE